MSQPPRSLREIKNDFFQNMKYMVKYHFDISLVKGSITISDLEKVAKKKGQGWYFHDKFIDENNQLKRGELADFVHQNISEFSFYEPDIV